MMQQAFKDAVTICKTILRNGYDAYVVNMQLQKEIMHEDYVQDIDLACACCVDDTASLSQMAHQRNKVLVT